MTYDPRGAERSPRTDGAAETTPDEHADDLHRLISALDAGPVDIFASSGGAVNALALVARHPEQVRDAGGARAAGLPGTAGPRAVLAACVDIRQTYQRDGFGPAMAKFIALVSYQGPFPAGYADQPAPDPAISGCRPRTTAPGTARSLGQNIVTCPAYRHDFGALRPRPPGWSSGWGRLRPDGAGPRGPSRGRTARHGARHLPRRPRRVPRRRIRRHGRTRRLRRDPAHSPRRLMPGNWRWPHPPETTAPADSGNNQISCTERTVVLPPDDIEVAMP